MQTIQVDLVTITIEPTGQGRVRLSIESPSQERVDAFLGDDDRHQLVLALTNPA